MVHFWSEPIISHRTGRVDADLYNQGYTLTQCAFILRFGKLYILFSPKWTFLTSLFIFELGSLICGVAPSSMALILGVSVSNCQTNSMYADHSILQASHSWCWRGWTLCRGFGHYHAHVSLGKATNLAKSDQRHVRYWVCDWAIGTP